MDSRTFDRLTMSVATGTSRRELLRRLAGGSIGLAAIGASAGRTRAQSCAGIQESCVDLDCCYGYGCNENNICIAAAECAYLGGGCLVDEQCCGDLVCDASGTCIGLDGDDDEDGGTAATELPSTGVGPSNASTSSTSWLTGVAAAAAGTALLAGLRRRDVARGDHAGLVPVRLRVRGDNSAGDHYPRHINDRRDVDS